jgi:dihydropyrimidinase
VEGAQRAGRACIDYGFHMMVTDVNPGTLAEMPTMIDEGVTTFKLFTAYPGTNYSDDGASSRRCRPPPTSAPPS